MAEMPLFSAGAFAPLPDANFLFLSLVGSTRPVQSLSVGGASIHSARCGLVDFVSAADRARSSAWEASSALSAAEPGAGGREGP